MNKSISIFLVSLILISVSYTAFSQYVNKGLSPVPTRPYAKEFSLRDIDGKQHILSDYKGQVVIVNFWATWCLPCREEMPSMQRAWEQLKDDNVTLLGINVGGDEESINSFLDDYPVDFPILMDTDSSVTTEWAVLGLPTTFVVDPAGKVVYRAYGGREWDDPYYISAMKSLNKKQM